jgi:collagen type XVII alpha
MTEMPTINIGLSGSETDLIVELGAIGPQGPPGPAVPGPPGPASTVPGPQGATGPQGAPGLITLSATAPVPPGTPAGTVILRTAT